MTVRNPEKPLDARIRSLSSTVLQWILPGITGIVGIVFLGVTLAVHRFMQADQKQEK